VTHTRLILIIASILSAKTTHHCSLYQNVSLKTPAILVRRQKMKTLLKNGSRERNQCYQRNNTVKRPDHPAFDPVTALRSVPGCH